MGGGGVVGGGVGGAVGEGKEGAFEGVVGWRRVGWCWEES